MITLKIMKATLPGYDVKNSNRAFHQEVANWQLWGSYLLKIRIKRKQKLDSLLFHGENNSKAFKSCWVIPPKSPPLSDGWKMKTSENDQVSLVDSKNMSVDVCIKSVTYARTNFMFDISIWTSSCANLIFNPEEDMIQWDSCFVLHGIQVSSKPSIMLWISVHSTKIQA